MISETTECGIRTIKHDGDSEINDGKDSVHMDVSCVGGLANSENSLNRNI
jgi:hypothetical protein